MNIDDIKVEKDLKIVFMGTPEFSAVVLKKLMEHYKIRAIVTRPDKQVGRGGKIIYSPLKQIALDNTILLLQPTNLKREMDDIISLEPDLIITCAYGALLPKEILECPRLGCINVHASLLPKLRGGAPIHRAIINGYKKTGITIMYMNEGLDTGDIISQEEIEINSTDTASILHDKLSVLGANLLIKTLPSIINGTNNRIRQDDSESTFASVITKEDEKIDFGKTKKQVCNLIRGLNSWPGAYCILENHRLKVFEARETNEFYPGLLDGQITNIYNDGIGVKVSNGEIVLTVVQLEGKNKMSCSAFLNGIKDPNLLIGKILN